MQVGLRLDRRLFDGRGGPWRELVVRRTLSIGLKLMLKLYESLVQLLRRLFIRVSIL